jgi:hypothetical protein
MAKGSFHTMLDEAYSFYNDNGLYLLGTLDKRRRKSMKIVN